jgi:predicted glycoside hydrolase/deacetylase ChbG (UPF0249 family)
MNSNEFIYWLRGIVDSTTFMPTKETWDIIVDVIKTVKLSKKEPTPLNDAVVHRLNVLNSPGTGNPNPYEIKCDNTTKQGNPLKD